MAKKLIMTHEKQKYRDCPHYLTAIGSSGFTYSFQPARPTLKQNVLMSVAGSIVQAGSTVGLNTNTSYQAQLNNIQIQINNIQAQIDQLRAQRSGGGIMYTNGNIPQQRK